MEKISLSSLPRPVRSEGIRLVAALTPRETSLFLGSSQTAAEVLPSLVFAENEQFDPERWTEQLDAWQPHVLITGWTTPALPESWIAGPNCPLRYVCHVAGSVRGIVPRIFLERGGLVSNWGDRISGQVAEHALLLALSALRNQSEWPRYIARPIATRQITDLGTRTLFGLRVGLHGFGGVARALIPLIKPFGVTFHGYSTGVPDEIMTSQGVRPVATLDELFADSDVLFECEALTPSTRGSVSAKLLSMLPDGAVFVNVGRGGLVDDDALVREGMSGRIRLALDVVSVEPLAPNSPFVAIPGIVLSPHIGGPTSDRYLDCGAHALANVARFLAGDVPVGAITLSMYDRAT